MSGSSLRNPPRKKQCDFGSEVANLLARGYKVESAKEEAPKEEAQKEEESKEEAPKEDSGGRMRHCRAAWDHPPAR